MKRDGEKYMYGFQCSLRVLKTVFPDDPVRSAPWRFMMVEVSLANLKVALQYSACDTIIILYS